jgi:hypothetical protein
MTQRESTRGDAFSDVDTFVRRHVGAVPAAEPGHEARLRRRLAERRRGDLQRLALVLGVAGSLALVTTVRTPRGVPPAPGRSDAQAAAILADSFADVDEGTDVDLYDDGLWAP